MELEVDKKYINKIRIKKVEIEYGDMEYIIANLFESVIDVNGVIKEYKVTPDVLTKIEKEIWGYENLDEFEYWPDKTKDHAPMSPMWRLSWWDENGSYHHKSGATKYPERFMDLINVLKELIN